jgi:hypothetical protein
MRNRYKPWFRKPIEERILEDEQQRAKKKRIELTREREQAFWFQILLLERYKQINEMYFTITSGL